MNKCQVIARVQVSQNFGLSWREQNFEEFIVHVKHFLHGCGAWEARQQCSMEVPRPICAANFVDWVLGRTRKQTNNNTHTQNGNTHTQHGAHTHRERRTHTHNTEHTHRTEHTHTHAERSTHTHRTEHTHTRRTEHVKTTPQMTRFRDAKVCKKIGYR